MPDPADTTAPLADQTGQALLGDAMILPPRLDLTAARRLARDLRDEAGSALRIDASEVEMLGGLCLQVLLAAAQDWRRRGMPLHYQPRSSAFDAALAQFGLSPSALENGAPT